MKSKRGIIIIIFIVITVFAKTSYSKQEVNYKVTSIGLGETLWSIAKKEQETNKYYEGKDIRFVINDIKYNNNLKDSNLYAGMELKIPSM